MPTKEALVKRTIINDQTCDRCRLATETPFHALWSCSEVDVVWADQTLWDFRNHVGFNDFKQLVSWIVEEGKPIERFTWMVWAIWNQRNQVRVRAPAIALHHVAEVSRSSLTEYRSRLSTTELLDEPHSHHSQTRWLPPPGNLVKINFDGAVFSRENISGIGVVVRDENGLVLGSCTKRLSQAYSVMETEAMEAATALVFASELGVRQAILKGDSLAVIKALIETKYPLSPLGLEDVRMFSQRFDKMLYSHTKREGNFVAHSLARYPISIPDFLVWTEDVPPHVQKFVQADLASFS
ncbi:uncharacterized protein LOC142632642 [Castanea sativa]|uniref:uncharacterized protein LOC142632642 n=1 Tax=Castanea sativa TaxID=21020 RepID=UPI003F64F647